LDREAARGLKQLKCHCGARVETHTCWRRNKSDKGESERHKRRKKDDHEQDDSNNRTAADGDDLEERDVQHPYNPHPEIDAFRIWLLDKMKLDPQARNEFFRGGLLVNQMFSVDVNDDGGASIKRAGFVLSKNGEYTPSEADEVKVVTCARWLHSAILPLSFTPKEEDGKHRQAMTPAELMEHTPTKEKRLLPRFLFSLATGKIPYENIDKKDADHQGQVLSAMLASDLIVRAHDSRKDIGYAVEMLSFQVANSSTNQLIDLLARMNITIARATMRRRKAKET